MDDAIRLKEFHKLKEIITKHTSDGRFYDFVGKIKTFLITEISTSEINHEDYLRDNNMIKILDEMKYLLECNNLYYEYTKRDTTEFNNLMLKVDKYLKCTISNIEKCLEKITVSHIEPEDSDIEGSENISAYNESSKDLEKEFNIIKEVFEFKNKCDKDIFKKIIPDSLFQFLMGIIKKICDTFVINE